MGWKLVIGGLLFVAGCSAGNVDRTDPEPYVPLPARAVSSAEPSPQQQKGTPSSTASVPGTTTTTAAFNGVVCGSTICEGATPQCCQTQNSAKCIADNDPCSGFVEECDQASDCAKGEVCCADVLNGDATCVDAAKCTGAARMLMCVGDGDCSNGTSCRALVANIDHFVCK